MANVFDFGADPNGKDDSQPAVEAAIEAASAAGDGVVYFPSGSYRMSCVRPKASAFMEDETSGGTVEAD